MFNKFVSMLMIGLIIKKLIGKVINKMKNGIKNVWIIFGIICLNIFWICVVKVIMKMIGMILFV